MSNVGEFPMKLNSWGITIIIIIIIFLSKPGRFRLGKTIKAYVFTNTL